jgi:plastocyanin
MHIRIAATLASGLLAVTAMGVAAQSPGPDTTHQMASTARSGAGGAIDSPAADLRTTLNLKLGEHIILALKATDAGLRGDSGAFDAYNILLNTNGTEIGAMLGSLYGQDAQDAFNVLWSAHNGGFVAYTNAVAAGDQAQQDQVLADLTTSFVPDFSTFIADATGLPLEAVTTLVAGHIDDTRVVIDAQAAADWPAAYAGVRTAFAHMQMIGDALSGALVAKFPDQLSGDPNAAAVDFRVALNQLLQEHMYLVSFASAAQLAGYADEMAAAIVSLNTNGTDIGGAIGSLFGQSAADQFNIIWSAHNGLFVDYANGVLAGDQQVQDEAMEALTTDVAQQLSSFLAGATGLPEDVLTQLVTDHFLNTRAVIDAQSSGDATAVAAADLAAARHMQGIGDPLAAGIVAALPDSFPAATAAPATGAIPVTLADFTITPGTIDATGSTIVFDVVNNGPTPHNMAVRDDAGTVLGTTTDLTTGGTETLTITVPGPGTYITFCSLPGHEALGLKGTLVVAPATEAPASVSPAESAAAGDTITMVDVAFQPTRLTIAADTDTTISVPNTGTALHTFSSTNLTSTSRSSPARPGW